MGVSDTAAQSPEKGRSEAPKRVTVTAQHADTDTMLLAGAWLVAARVVWVLVAILSVGLFIMAVPATYDRLNTLNFILHQSGRDIASRGFAQLGVSTGFFAGYNVVIAVARTLFYFVVAGILFARKSNDLMTYFVSIFLLTFSVGRMVQVMQVDENWGIPAATLITIAYSSFVLFFYVFPNGRFVPGWTRLLAPVLIAIITLAFFFPGTPVDIRTYSDYGMAIATTTILALGAFTQSYRYRHASSRTEKQQIKWVAYGAAIILILNVTFVAIEFLYPATTIGSPPGAPGVLFEFITSTVTTLQLLVIPIALGISMLRYRLWDIDLIINRTLVYVPLTGIVAGLYSATVALFQKLSQTFTGQQSDMAIILTTLILAALFTPLKNALQSLVDKRFKEVADPVKRLKALGQQVEQRIYTLDVRAVTRRLFSEATGAFEAAGALYLDSLENVRPPIEYKTEGWQDADAQLTVPIEAGDRVVGRLLLGHRREGRTYTQKESKALEEVAGQIAASIQVSVQK